MKRSILAAAIAATLLAGCTPVPSGQKNGTITKLAQTGTINKTWEAEIVRGGSFTGGTGVQGAAFDFTIDNPMLLQQVRDAFDNQREVRITYHKTWPAFWSSDSDGYFLDKIEIVSEEQGGTVRGGAQTAPAAPAQGGTTLTSAQVQQLLDNQSKTIDQQGQLIQLLEKRGQ